MDNQPSRTNGIGRVHLSPQPMARSTTSLQVHTLSGISNT